MGLGVADLFFEPALLEDAVVDVLGVGGEGDAGKVRFEIPPAVLSLGAEAVVNLVLAALLLGE